LEKYIGDKQCETLEVGGAGKRSLRMRRRGSYDGTTAPIQPVSTSEGGDIKGFAYFFKIQICSESILWVNKQNV